MDMASKLFTFTFTFTREAQWPRGARDQCPLTQHAGDDTRAAFIAMKQAMTLHLLPAVLQHVVHLHVHATPQLHVPSITRALNYMCPQLHVLCCCVPTV